MSQTPSYKSVYKKIEKWKSKNEYSIQRGRDAIEFVQKGIQWEANVEGKRKSQNKAVLTFNKLYSVLKQIQAKGKNIELSLDLKPTSENSQANIEENRVFGSILHHIALREECKRSYAHCLDKVYDVGGGVLFANIVKEDDTTLNKTISMVSFQDISRAFFDTSAQCPTYNDGAFCGFETEVSKDKFLSLYPDHKSNINEKNTIIDYWYKQPKPMKFVKLANGQYKREDLLTDTDILYREKKTQESSIMAVYHMRFLKSDESVLEDAYEWPGDDLPMGFNYGLTVWTEEGYESYPFCYHLYGAQKLHNMAGSQIATGIKNATGSKFLGNNQHIRTDGAKKAAKDLNTAEGFINLDVDKTTGKDIQYIPPSEISGVLPGIYEASKHEIDDLTGAYTEANSAIKATSGVALDKMFNRADILQNNVLEAHFHLLDVMGKVIQGMIPKLYHQINRKIVAESKDGTMQALIVNQEVGTGDIKNNVRNINANYRYKITADVSSELLKQNTLQAIERIIAEVPNVAPNIIDIYMKCIDSPYSEELARRVSMMQDPMMVKYSIGEISEQKWKQHLQQQQQQKEQKQMMIMQNNPQMIKAKTEAQKARSENDLNVAKLHQSSNESAEKMMVERLNALNKRLEIASKAQHSTNQLASHNYNSEADRAIKELELKLGLVGGLEHDHAIEHMY